MVNLSGREPSNTGGDDVQNSLVQLGFDLEAIPHLEAGLPVSDFENVAKRNLPVPNTALESHYPELSPSQRELVSLNVASFFGRLTEMVVMMHHVPMCGGNHDLIDDLRLSLRDYTDAVGTLEARSSRPGRSRYRISPILFSPEGGYLAPVVDRTCWMMAYYYVLKHQSILRSYSPHSGRQIWIKKGEENAGFNDEIRCSHGIEELEKRVEEEELRIAFGNVMDACLLRECVDRLWGSDIAGMVTPVPTASGKLMDELMREGQIGGVSMVRWYGEHLYAAYRYISTWFYDEAVRATFSLMTISRLLERDILGILGGMVIPNVTFTLDPRDWGESNSTGHGKRRRNRKDDVRAHGTSSSKYMTLDGLLVPPDTGYEIWGNDVLDRILERNGHRVLTELMGRGVEKIDLIEIKSQGAIDGSDWNPPTSVWPKHGRQALWYASTLNNMMIRKYGGNVRVGNVVFVYIRPGGFSIIKVPFYGDNGMNKLDFRRKEVILHV